MVVSFLPSCSCDGDPESMLSDGGDGSVPDSMPPIADSGPGSLCADTGASCNAAVGCCSGVCNSDGYCAEPEFCAGPGDVCETSTDCCTLHCLGGTCTSQLCLAVGQTCLGAEHCCSGICGSGGTCEAVPPGPGGDTCVTLGEACTADGDCCSTNCQGGVCVRAYSCQANGDVCFAHGDCCGNYCSADGTGPGRCQVVVGGGGGGCVQGGNPCSDGATCCSRVCTDLGSGASVCQVTTGCRLTGEWCTSDDECCGGGVNPNGTVACGEGPGGRCDNGQACNGVGNICGAPVLSGGGSVNASQNCCDGGKDVCKLDVSGVPRCFGGCAGGGCSDTCPTGYDWADPNCCIPADGECQFADQCCDRSPCLPQGDGRSVCAPALECLALGDSCTLDSSPNCCGGTSCTPTGVSGSYACAVSAPDAGVSDGGAFDGSRSDSGPPDAGPTDASGLDATAVDAAAQDAGACVANTGTCTTAGECCSGLCVAEVCVAPRACQPELGACTAAADCCEGLSCSVPPGATTGTCVGGATCGGLGQSCTLKRNCCGSFVCQSEGGLVCDGTSPCVCFVNL